MCLSTCGFAHIHSLHLVGSNSAATKRSLNCWKGTKSCVSTHHLRHNPSASQASMWRRAHSFCAGFSQPQYNDTAVSVRFQGLLYQAFSHHYKVVTHTLLVGDSHLYSSPVSAGMDIVIPIFLYCCTVRILTVFILILLLFRFFG